MKLLKRIIRLSLFIGFLQLLTLLIYVNIIGVNLYSKEIVFHKGDKKVVLLGVSHIGTKEYYKSISTRYPDFLVLGEGLKGKGIDADHSHTATLLGLESQPKDLFKGYRYLNSDIDASKISPNVGNVLSSSFSFWENIALKRNKKAFDQVENVKSSNVSISELYNEIIIKRNINIKNNILTIKENLYIPWGAIHMNDLENFLLTQGYKKEKTSYIKNFNILNSVYFLLSYVIS